MTDNVARPRIAALRFQPIGKLYHFDATEVADLLPGDYVMVSTSRGREMGEVVGFVEEPEPPAEGSWKKIERRATAAELVMRQQWQRRELEALIECRAQADEAGLRNVKIARAEYSYDGSRVAFLFVAEGD
jgi:cell fate regulator YaaT (PSP1 superfamily)